jgi:hypothetical protein
MCLVSRACLPYPYQTSGSRNRAQVPRPSSQLPEFQTAVPLTTTPYYRDPCRKPSSSRIFKRQGFLTGLASATALSNISETLPLASTSPVKRHRLGDSKDRPDHTLDTSSAPRYEDRKQELVFGEDPGEQGRQQVILGLKWWVRWRGSDGVTLYERYFTNLQVACCCFSVIHRDCIS